MKIGFISDLHGNLPQVDPCDILVICGDLLGGRTVENQVNFYKNDFVPWMNKLTSGGIGDVVYIAGNHDWLFAENRLEPISSHHHYLEDSGTTVQGIDFWGTPWTPKFNQWAFMLEEKELQSKYGLIPQNTEILISHGPPHGILDQTWDKRSVGSWALIDNVIRVDPNIHCFGHIHEGRGMLTECDELSIETVFINCSLVNLHLEPVHYTYYLEWH